MPLLLSIEEGGDQRAVEVAGAVATLGRSRHSTVPLRSLQVSSSHLELALTPSGLLARDLGSSNGTALLRAGKKKPARIPKGKAVPVEPGDVLLLGSGAEAVRVEATAVALAEEGLGDTIRATRSAAEVSASDLRTEALRTFLGLNRELLVATRVDEVLEVGLRRLLELLPRATHGSVAFFLPGEGRRLGRVVQLARGSAAPADVPASAVSATVIRKVPLERVVSDCVGLLLSEDVPVAGTVKALGLRSAACAPLWVGTEVLGVVQADVRSPATASGLEPMDLDRLLVLAGPLALALRHAEAVERTRRERDGLAAENARLRVELSEGRGGQPPLVGDGPTMGRLRDMIERVAPSDLPVLVTGETGTGKELVARTVHWASRRREAPFVASNVATLPRELAEAELFGAARGAYTGADAARPGLFEAADGGTLFLDEIGELHPSAQAQLLRALQEGELRRVGETKTRKVNVRLVAATNRDLSAAVREGTFRQDLLFRINTVTLEVPALRDRREDIPALVRHLLERVCGRQGRAVPELTDEVVTMLCSLPWPGNVRQLENELARAVALTRPGDPITASGLSPEGRGLDGDAEVSRLVDEGLPLKDAVGAFEREYVRATLEAHDGNRTRTAEALGLTRAGLQKLIKRHGLQD